jgi:hypothetical protein
MLSVRRRISAWAPHGTSGAAFTTVAGGAVKLTGAKVPWLIGSPGSRNPLSATITPAALTASDALTTPATWSELPVKSQWIVPSPTVRARRSSTGSRRPSW